MQAITVVMLQICSVFSLFSHFLLNRREFFQVFQIIPVHKLQYLDRGKKSGKKFQFRKPLRLKTFKDSLEKERLFIKAGVIADKKIHSFKQ